MMDWLELFANIVRDAQAYLAGVLVVALSVVTAITAIGYLARKTINLMRGVPVAERVIVGVFAVSLLVYGSTKPTVTYDGGIKRGESNNLITNDTVSIYWTRDTSKGVYVPDSAAVYIDYRTIGATNEEWGLLGQATVSDGGWSGTVMDATNYDYNVWAYYIPPEPVRTNGVWVYKTLMDRRDLNPIPLRARVEINGKAIATPKEVRKDIVVE